MPNEHMSSRHLPQPPDVATRIVIVALAGFIGFVALAMTGLFYYLKAAAPSAFRAVAENHFPEPALQNRPHDDLGRFEAEQRDALSGYGWVDKSKGLVRIPIKEAMRIVAARGDRAYDPLEPPANPTGPSVPDARNSAGTRQ